MVEVNGKGRAPISKEAGVRTPWHPVQGTGTGISLGCPVAAEARTASAWDRICPVITQVLCICRETLLRAVPKSEQGQVQGAQIHSLWGTERGPEGTPSLPQGGPPSRWKIRPLDELEFPLLGMAFSCDSNCQLLSVNVRLLGGPSAQLCSPVVLQVPCWGGKFDFKFNPQPPASHAHRLLLPRQTPSNPHKDTSSSRALRILLSQSVTADSWEPRGKVCSVQHNLSSRAAAGGVPGGQRRQPTSALPAHLAFPLSALPGLDTGRHWLAALRRKSRRRSF